MTDANSLVKSLGSLNSDDRLWVFGELNASERTKLGEMLRGGVHADGDSDFDEARERAGFDCTTYTKEDWDQLAQCLVDEPAWLVYAVAAQIPALRRVAFARRFPPRLRIEIAEIERRGVSISSSSRTLISRLVREALSKRSAVSPGTRRHSAVRPDWVQRVWKLFR